MVNILHISDIHFGWNKPEEDGVVLDSFFDDLETTLNKKENDENYCIISGDLVYKGCSEYEYKQFYNNFIRKLTNYIPLGNILVVAGNHDLNRTWVEDNIKEHKKDIYRERTEVEFNDYIEHEDCLLMNKFSHFNNFCINVMHIQDFHPSGYYRNITSDISVFMLNSALCSSGGAEDLVDEGQLKIETRRVNDWINNNKGRTKILVMHHPISHLKENYQNEINSMCRNGIDYVFVGHIHDYNVHQIDNGAKVFISPQLYSSKNDIDGYSIIKFDEGKLIEIAYKEWNVRHRKFMDGQSFTGTSGGKWMNEIRKNIPEIDIVRIKLQEDLDNAMTTYGIRPKWIERKLSCQCLDQRHDKKEKDLDYLDILNETVSYQIIAPAQFGITCYARYLSLKAWEKFSKKWVYVDAKEWSLSKVDSEFEKAHRHLNINIEESDCVIIDNWKNDNRDNEKISLKLKRLLNNKRAVFLTHDAELVNIDLYIEDDNSIKCLYLKEISRNDLHVMVNSIDVNHIIADENVVVERLNQDIIALNMHRIPHNSIQFIKSYTSNFEKRPINRTKVVEGVLRAIFDNPGNLTYGGEIDDSNCKFIMGYFCQYLITNDKLYFTHEEFIKVCKPFIESQYNSTNLYDLLQILINNQVIEAVGDSLQFRQIYWVSYFVALRMKDDSDFANYMLETKNGLYNQDLIDFYTGIDGRNIDAVNYLTNKLKELSVSVSQHVGIDGSFNPFKNIKWTLTETQQGITQEKLAESIKNSRMPDDIKDAIADENYDSVKPYNQQIYTFLDKYEVRNLIQILLSASRALRNSEFISPTGKEELAKSIFEGWDVLMRVLFYIAPLMAKNGYGGYGGANFKLSEDFPKDFAECLKMIIVNMPYNIVKWYKNEIFSDKLTLLFEKYLKEYDNEFVRHLIALIICYCRPKNFQNILSSYIANIGKNTFYLGDLYTSLRDNYSYDFMTKHELSSTGLLIKSCYMKHVKGITDPGRDSISKFEHYQGQLPERLIDETNE